ncbi:MAG: calcium-binding protein, partial [Sulfitobacter sp.]
DYNVEHDALVVETDDENTFVTHQTVSEGSLKVSLSTGLTITLPGVDNPLNDDVISFVLTNPLRDGG